MSTYALSLFIFRRDLRLQDNTALIAAMNSSQAVMPCFILDDRQVKDNPYKGDALIQFMLTSLAELNQDLQNHHGKLYQFDGIAEDVVAELLDKYPIEAVFINRDYTPFARTRDKHIEQVCKAKKVDFHIYADALLTEPEQSLKSNKLPYTIYTPAARHAREFEVAKPEKLPRPNFYNKDVKLENPKAYLSLLKKFNDHLLVKGGRAEGLRLLKDIKNHRDYKLDRDFPAKEGTTHLSAHNKFGTVSVREVYWKIVETFNKQHTLINELYWRDFFTHIAFHFPRVFKEAFQERFNKVKWSNNTKHFEAWCEGMTGFPIVDAGMRELNATGYMHNRVRMVVASFLVKDLHIDWHLGERYFANKLVDYDAAVNNGNWQWAASTGCDAQPYFRIFNPWLQQEKFDVDCTYIKTWIPELRSLDADSIHRWHLGELAPATSYPRPIIDHKTASQEAKLRYQDAIKHAGK